MSLERIENPATAEVGSGVYYLMFAAPDYLLRQVRYKPRWADEVVRRVLEEKSVHIRVLGHGVVNDREDGELRRYYGVTIEVSDQSAGISTQQVAAVAISLAVIASAIAAVLIFNPDRWVKAYRRAVPPEDRGALPDAIGEAAESLGLFAWAAILFGGAALVYAASRWK